MAFRIPSTNPQPISEHPMRCALLGTIIALLCSALSAQNTPTPTPAATCTDTTVLIARATQTRRPQLLYLWSPRMPLSAHEANAPHQSAKYLSIDWHPVYDSDLPPEEIQNALQVLSKGETKVTRQNYRALRHSRPLCRHALLLLPQGDIGHYPRAWLLRPTHPFSNAIIGAMPAPYWRARLREKIINNTPKK